MNAEQARQQTEETVAAQIADLQSFVMKKISDAVKRGDYSTMVSISGKSPAAHTGLRQLLLSDGYTIEESSDDQRDYGYVTISWEKK